MALIINPDGTAVIEDGIYALTFDAETLDVVTLELPDPDTGARVVAAWDVADLRELMNLIECVAED